MNTFDLALTGDWQEVLNGGSAVVFDLVQDASITVYFNESDDEPTAAGNLVASWPAGWDFEAPGMRSTIQRIWVKGSGSIRGVR